MELVDTHCHIQAIGSGDEHVGKRWHDGGIDDVQDMIDGAKQSGVTRMIAVGTQLQDSKLAIECAKAYDAVWASAGVHPHDGANFIHTPGSKEEFASLIDSSNKELVAIGECGLDYHYEHSSREDQIELLEFQLELAVTHDLPVIFHVRDAFDDFWSIFDNFKGLRGVVHSFSSTPEVLHEVLKRDLYVGLNGIMTFTKDQLQLEAAKIVPRSMLLLETDAPYLTPKPFRGKVCMPEHTRLVAIFLATLRGEQLEIMAQATTANAQKLFGLQ